MSQRLRVRHRVTETPQSHGVLESDESSEKESSRERQTTQDSDRALQL
jgi:hypothetical protein